ncbi:reverse transcriptase/maturase family protein [Patescibacteria group bacterium]|nr:reverse transcriptase/maturase family protein [Patescibacteria group bacterium]MBU1472795.1 reverse transcriptase/maturase family protein [Patescibacteria group bacterium]MBU2459730.1 reverse transcriptase/maturase family protein [Patescibacteria group bacterium]MBU2544414.1 reverse transcriptase/maturase family protein [Patescibacteria group bacterium]
MRAILSYDALIAPEQLFLAWEEFRLGKSGKPEVQLFVRTLEDSLFALHTALKRQTYQHGNYEAFWVNDPKRRHIHKAPVVDRVVHHILYTYLYDLFDPTFIHDSYSCRLGKGTHKGVERLVFFTRKVSQNYTRTCWALQFDIRRFFARADHKTLKLLLRRKIQDENILWLLDEVIDSFHSEMGYGKGIPLGNLTSQVFANIYLHELDHFMKHTLKVHWYIRYADDGVVVSSSRTLLEKLIEPIEDFLHTRLALTLHPRKVTIRKLSWGIDFLGYIVLPHYMLPRTKTKKRLVRRLKKQIELASFEQSWASYCGYLSHSSSFRLRERLKNDLWLIGGING